jgi:hypothetical protein
LAGLDNEYRSPTKAAGNWSGGLLRFAAALATVSALVASAALFGWPRDRTLWVGVGTLLAVLTLSRPRWFWENWKGRMLRNLIGDAATTALYLVIAAAVAWIGLTTEWKFGRH